MHRYRAAASSGVVAIITALVFAVPLTAHAAVDETSPHDFRDLEWTIEVSGDHAIPMGAKRLVTLYVRNPKDYSVYLFKTSSESTHNCTSPPVTCVPGTVTDYGPVTAFMIQVVDFQRASALTKLLHATSVVSLADYGAALQAAASAVVLNASRSLDESSGLTSYDTITPTGQRTPLIYPSLASVPIFSYLLDTANIPQGEYEVLISGIVRSNGPADVDVFIGSRRIQVVAADANGGSNGSTTTQRPPETPWQTGASGTLYTNIAWNYNMGYQFVPQVNGKITKLGGFFNGTKTVRLYDSSGSILAFTDVSAANSWGYAAVNPVAVTAGKMYTVAVNLAGSGGSYRMLGSAPLPKTFGKIQVLRSVYRSASDQVPASGSTAYMYGQADIEFVPDQ